jgi:hypothetical protein
MLDGTRNPVSRAARFKGREKAMPERRELELFDFTDPAEYYRLLCARALEAGDDATAEWAAGEAVEWMEVRGATLEFLLSA